MTDKAHTSTLIRALKATLKSRSLTYEDLAKRPEHYLPWVYRDRLEQRDTLSQAQPPPPSAR